MPCTTWTPKGHFSGALIPGGQGSVWRPRWGCGSEGGARRVGIPGGHLRGGRCTHTLGGSRGAWCWAGDAQSKLGQQVQQFRAEAVTPRRLLPHLLALLHDALFVTCVLLK